MKFVTLGSSGLKVSAICIGGNSWGADGRRDWAAFDKSDSVPFFRHALDSGINFLIQRMLTILDRASRLLAKH